MVKEQTFAFSLPISKQQNSNGSSYQIIGNKMEDCETNNRILLVDNEPDIALAFKIGLRR